MSILRILSGLGVVFLLHATCLADFVYEGMNYPAGSQLVQQSGGEGFNGGWYAGGFNAATNNFTINSTSLSYSNLVVAQGSALTTAGSNINGVARNVPSTLLDPGTHYLSFLINRMSTAGNFGGLYLMEVYRTYSSESLGRTVFGRWKTEGVQAWWLHRTLARTSTKQRCLSSKWSCQARRMK